MIFISYAWLDASVAHQVHRRLKFSGHETWIDFERLDLACGIESQLRDAIRSAKRLLLVDSPAARLSKWISFELACAQKAGIPVTPVSTLLSDSSWLFYRDPVQDCIQRIPPRLNAGRGNAS
jgi:hypothetical protein